MKQSIFGKD